MTAYNAKMCDDAYTPTPKHSGGEFRVVVWFCREHFPN